MHLVHYLNVGFFCTECHAGNDVVSDAEKGRCPGVLPRVLGLLFFEVNASAQRKLGDVSGVGGVVKRGGVVFAHHHGEGAAGFVGADGPRGGPVSVVAGGGAVGKGVGAVDNEARTCGHLVGCPALNQIGDGERTEAWRGLLAGDGAADVVVRGRGVKPSDGGGDVEASTPIEVGFRGADGDGVEAYLVGGIGGEGAVDSNVRAGPGSIGEFVADAVAICCDCCGGQKSGGVRFPGTLGLSSLDAVEFPIGLFIDEYLPVVGGHRKVKLRGGAGKSKVGNVCGERGGVEAGRPGGVSAVELAGVGSGGPGIARTRLTRLVVGGLCVGDGGSCGGRDSPNADGQHDAQRRQQRDHPGAGCVGVFRAEDHWFFLNSEST